MKNKSILIDLFTFVYIMQFLNIMVSILATKSPRYKVISMRNKSKIIRNTLVF